MSWRKGMIAIAIVTLILIVKLSENTTVAASAISGLDCQTKCGNVSVPYPFGIGDNCGYNNIFDVNCNQSVNPPKLIYGTNIELLEINVVDAQIRMLYNVARECYDTSTGRVTSGFQPWMWLAKFTINTTLNVFAAIGCDTYATFTGYRKSDRTYQTGCMTGCSFPEDVDNGTCTGLGCCETQIPKDVRYLVVNSRSFSNYTNMNSTNPFTPCSSAFIVARDSFNFTLANLTMDPQQMPASFPVVYDWTIGDETCTTANEKGECLCCTHPNSGCRDSELGGYTCHCLPGYAGNPYLAHGCQDINECLSKSTEGRVCKKPATCFNTKGSYHCVCPKGFQGNGTTNHPCVPSPIIPNHQNGQIRIILGVSGSTIFLLLLILVLFWHHGKKKIEKMRKKFFRENGGTILRDRLSARDVSVDLIKIFTVEDLKNATNNYSEDNIIGRGGFGTVYKGTLQNNQVVAIKKSIKVDSSQKEQFVNEVILLSQLNNKNVVKLIGCCLEDEVPLLVYEFISNGTLHEHLHDERKASMLSWNIRLRIATEVAEVLAYLHTTISTPIIHRDMKPANILLDENYVAKVSDFGASRTLVPINQDQEATMVQGTRGYLDPEYMQTGELNEKSDVYSFGVVVIELLTGREVISYNRPEKERILAMHFLSKFKEQRVLEIVDQKIKREEDNEQFEEVAILARRCLEVKGEDRPTMKEVAVELERIIRRTDHVHQWTSKNVGLSEDEGQYLLSKSLEDDGCSYYDEKDTMDMSNPQSSVLQLLPLGDGR